MQLLNLITVNSSTTKGCIELLDSNTVRFSIETANDSTSFYTSTLNKFDMPAETFFLLVRTSLEIAAGHCHCSINVDEDLHSFQVCIERSGSLGFVLTIAEFKEKTLVYDRKFIITADVPRSYCRDIAILKNLIDRWNHYTVKTSWPYFQ